MSTPPNPPGPRADRHPGRWVVPAVAVAGGLVMFAAQAAHGHAGAGLAALAVLAAYAAVLALLAGRSETVSLLRGDPVDERASLIQLRATAFTGTVLVTVLVGGFLVELARGAGDTGTWAGLCVVGGLSLVGATVVLRRSS